MEISKVPIIEGPNFGGVIYGLNLEIGYSEEPSVLTLNIISKDGDYNPLPILNEPIKISFGSFTFNGIIWSYDIKETLQDKILEVQIKDHSVILDRYYVKKWERGKFGIDGNLVLRKKIVEFDNEDVVPIYSRKIGTFTLVKLKNQEVQKKVYEAYGVKNNIIYLGKESFPKTECDIPETYYTLENLKNILKNYNIVEGVDFTAPPELKKNTEGSLRTVLKSWAEACGIGFYWDFTNNKIKTYVLNEGIKLQLPDITSTRLIAKTASSSLDNTFINYAMAYTKKPKEPMGTQTGEFEESAYDFMHAVPISRFLRNDGTLDKINEYKNVSLYENTNGEVVEVQEGFDDPLAAELALWGGREEHQFLSAAFLGYFSPEIREIYLYNLIWEVLGNESLKEKVGYKVFKNVGVTLRSPQPELSYGAALSERGENYLYRLKQEEINNIYDLLVDNAELQRIKELEIEFVGKNNAGEPKKFAGEAFWFWVGVEIEGLAKTWFDLEQKILNLYGKYYYYQGTQPFTSYICTPKFFMTVSTSASPEATRIETPSSEFKGKKWYERGGNFSHDPNQVLGLIGLNEDDKAEILDNIVVRKLDIAENNLNQMFPNIKTGTQIFIVPKYSYIRKKYKSFDWTITTSLNPLEKKWSDAEGGGGNGFPKCNLLDDQIDKGKCLNFEDEARKKATSAAYRELGENEPLQSSSADDRTGLNSTLSKAIKMNFFGKPPVTLCAPSFGSIRTFTTTRRQITFIPPIDYNQKIYYNLDDEKFLKDYKNVATVNIFDDNVTETDDFWSRPREVPLQLAKSIVNKEPTKKIEYTFAGNPADNLNLSVSEGLSSLDITYSDQGFETKVVFSSRPPLPQPTESDNILRMIESRVNRASLNAL